MLMNLLFKSLQRPEEEQDKYQDTTGSKIAGGIGNMLNGGPLGDMLGGSLVGNGLGLLAQKLMKKKDNEEEY